VGNSSKKLDRKTTGLSAMFSSVHVIMCGQQLFANS